MSVAARESTIPLARRPAPLRRRDRRLRLVAGQPLVHQMHRQAEPAAAVGREGLRLLGLESGRAVHVEGMPQHQVGDAALRHDARQRAATAPRASFSVKAGSGVATPSSSP